MAKILEFPVTTKRVTGMWCEVCKDKLATHVATFDHIDLQAGPKVVLVEMLVCDNCDPTDHEAA